jgi:ABC-type uncharacterized transport system auxiliary subunit
MSMTQLFRTSRIASLATFSAAALVLAGCASTPLEEKAPAPVVEKRHRHPRQRRRSPTRAAWHGSTPRPRRSIR